MSCLDLERVARESYGKLVALLAAQFRDLASAEDALSDALMTALVRWPEDGIPASPEGWLLTVARRKLLDLARQSRNREQHAAELQEALAWQPDAFQIPDRRLALFLVCAHPAIDYPARAPLILQTVLGFDAARIASIFLQSPSAMSQRLVRAKRKIRDARISFELPTTADLPERLDAVLEAVYAAYSDGWSDPLRVDPNEAIWLASVLTGLCPAEPEVLGLHALLLYTDSRRAARRNSQGDYIALDSQDTQAWDAAMIAQAEELLAQAARFGKAGRFQLEAAIQSAHAARGKTGRANWEAILQLYDALLLCAPSPVIVINRAVAVAAVHGAALGLAQLDTLADDPRTRQYQPYWATRAEFLHRLGDKNQAGSAYQQAIGLQTDPAVRRFLQGRLAELLD